MHDLKFKVPFIIYKCMIKRMKISSHMHEHNTLISSISATKTDIQQTYLLLFQSINSLALDSSFCSFLKQLSSSLLLEKKMCIVH